VNKPRDFKVYSGLKSFLWYVLCILEVKVYNLRHEVLKTVKMLVGVSWVVTLVPTYKIIMRHKNQKTTID
jgi:hypothetical protein